MFCIWNVQRDTTEPFFSKNNYQPPNRPVENGVFNDLGRGNWESCSRILLDALDWRTDPWELVAKSHITSVDPALASELGPSRSVKVYPGDCMVGKIEISYSSSTNLSTALTPDFDLVITDPPFGDIMQYAEFSGFFYAWLKIAFAELGVEESLPEQPPTTLEAVENSHRHGKETRKFYTSLDSHGTGIC